MSTDNLPEPAGEHSPDSSDSGDSSDVSAELIAASLRADTADLEIYARVLSSSLIETLPPGAVTLDQPAGARRGALAGLLGFRRFLRRVRGADRRLAARRHRGPGDLRPGVVQQPDRDPAARRRHAGAQAQPGRPRRRPR